MFFLKFDGGVAKVHSFFATQVKKTNHFTRHNFNDA